MGQWSLEKPKDWKPSGHSYVAAWFEGKREKIPIMNEVSCDHVANICSDCAKRWEYDYVLLYDKTAGGRRLKRLMST